MEMAWNKQLEQLVDAGIPLCFMIAVITDRGDSAVFYRTLKANIIDYTYSYADSSHDVIIVSKNYPLVYLALDDFRRWKFRVAKNVTRCQVEVTLLPSRVSRLNRMVDMSDVWGQRKISAEYVFKIEREE
jgi:hypothetical protein